MLVHVINRIWNEFHAMRCIMKFVFYFSHCGQNCPENTLDGQMYLQGGGARQHDVTALLLAWRCHRQQRHDVVLWTTKTTSKSDYVLKIKAWEKNNQSLHFGRDKGIPSSCPWFATSTTRQASSWIANHGHSDGIPLSLSECSDRFY